MGCSVGLKYAKNALVAGAPPRTPLGELTHESWVTTLPRPPSRLGRGTPPSHVPPPRHLRRLDSRAFGASILVPSVEAWCSPML